ncbi:MAG: hypothetical protein WKF50_14475, partial [Nocardioides sp.]
MMGMWDMGNGVRRVIVGALGIALATVGLGSAAAPAGAGALQRATATATATAADRQAGPDGVREVVFVGNNWDGTADLLAPQTFKRLGRINVIPDKEARMREIVADPYRLAFFLGIRMLIGEGNDQFVDDM